MTDTCVAQRADIAAAVAEVASLDEATRQAAREHATATSEVREIVLDH